MQLLIVIPTLDEAEHLGRTLDSLRTQSDSSVEIVVVDGGSTDGTFAVAASRGVRFILSPERGRGCQIAAALREVRAPVVLVVHADTVVPPGALSLIRKALFADPNCPGGCLGHRFDGSRRIYRFIEWWDRARARMGQSYGDQAQFFRLEALEQQGGFPDQPVMEDIELSRRLSRIGWPVYLDFPVTVSSRRFQRLGWLNSARVNLWLRFKYRLFGKRACRELYRSYYARDEQS